MTFGEVPIGHVFKSLGCDCLRRKTTENNYVYVQHCSKHRTWTPMMVGGFAKVRYDPFVAILEAQL